MHGYLLKSKILAAILSGRKHPGVALTQRFLEIAANITGMLERIK